MGSELAKNKLLILKLQTFDIKVAHGFISNAIIKGDNNLIYNDYTFSSFFQFKFFNVRMRAGYMQFGKLSRFYIRCLIMNGRSENYNYTKFSENYQTMLSQLELLLYYLQHERPCVVSDIERTRML